METKKSGSVRDIVNYTAGTDARETVVDAKTGAKIRIDIDGAGYDEDTGKMGEPFYIEHGDNLYDAFDRKEAMMILSNIRKGKQFPDMPDSPKPRKPRAKKSSKRSSSTPTSMQGIR